MDMDKDDNDFDSRISSFGINREQRAPRESMAVGGAEMFNQSRLP
jgi:hypothetical protein